MTKHHPKPLTGFGPIGWVGVVVLVALVVLVSCGRDFMWDYLKLVGAVVGDDEIMMYVARYHLQHGIALLYKPSFNLVTMIVVIIGLWICPRPLGWWRYTLVIAWALFHPLAWIRKPVVQSISDWIDTLAPALTFSRSWAMAEGLMEVASALVVFIATRSWRLSLAVAGLILGTTAFCTFNQLPGATASFAPPTVVVGWQLAFTAIVLTWAIRARVTFIGEGHCAACGYDLTDLLSRRCPECGERC